MLRFLTVASKIFVGLFLLQLWALSAAAQSRSTDASTPVGLSPSAPSGYNSLAGYDEINLFNGDLKFALPLLTVNGRGGASHTLVLPINKRWTVRHSLIDTWNEIYSHVAEEAWWSGFESASYSPGKLIGRQSNTGECRVPGAQVTGTYTLLTFVGQDGSELNFYDDLNKGGTLTGYCTGGGAGASRGTVFKTADGTAATFVSDAEIRDEVALNGWQIYPSGNLFLRDGTRYRVYKGKVTLMRDRNGNELSFTYNQPEQPHARVTKITDSLGREVNISYTSGNVITYKGFGGADRTIRVEYTNLGNALRSGHTLKTMSELFGLDNGNFVYDTSVVSAVVLPDGVSRYRFYYNSYAELARVELPTGGAFEYDWGAMLAGGAASGVVLVQTTANGATHSWPEIYRRVLTRRVMSRSNAVEGITTFSQTQGQGTAASVVDVDYKKPDGTLLTRERHHFHGNPIPHGETNPLGADAWKLAREYQTDIFDSNGQTLLRRAAYTWEQAVIDWYFNHPIYGNTRVSQAVVTLADSNQVSKQTYSYDIYNNVTDVYEYDYGSGAPGPLLRRTHTDYVTDASYTSRTGAHLRILPRARQLYGFVGGVETLVARSETLYDQYALTAYGPVTGWADPGTGARGNATTQRAWLDTTNTWIESQVRYDQVGNVVSATDPKGNTSTVAYADSFADGVPRNTYAYPTQSTSPVPDPTNTRATNTPLTGSSVYDYWTGLARTRTDANGHPTHFQHYDPFERLTRVDRPDGGWTVYWYDRNAHGDYVGTRTSINASQHTEAYKFFDGMGRFVRSFQYDGSQWITSDTQYDALGRTWRRSAEPYLTGGSGSPVNPSGRWIETGFDALSRVAHVRTTADGAQVTTSYSGNRVTATDPAGRARRSEADALGRLTQVIEAPGVGACQPDGAGCATTYAYDPLGNLRKVDQGGQHRYFMYDSLGRLVRVRQPEQDANAALGTSPDPWSGNAQWSLGFSYDANSNLHQRTDARNVTTTYSYDNVNRLKQTSYSDSTPYTLHTWDFAQNGRGRFYANYESSTSGTINYVLAYDAAGRPTSGRADFYLNGTGWVGFYTMSRAYDLAGNVTAQTYPSGRTVNYTQFDVVGRLKRMSGNLGDGVTRTYATGFATSGAETGIQYDAASRMTREAFGTQTTLHHKRHFNARGQLYDVRLGSALDEWSWNRGAVIAYYDGQRQWGGSGPDNNGNVTRLQHWVPGDDAVNSYALSDQYFEYDALNRLKSVAEYKEGTYVARQHAFTQAFDYDRWGNRQINAAATFGAGIPEPQFAVNTANNRVGVPAGFAGSMQYDAAGNLTFDTYTGAGARTYDAENRMTSAAGPGSFVNHYVYDAGGKRVRRRDAAGEVWHVYGLSGELLSEYAPNGAPSQPLKEYAYRGGQPLVVAESALPVNFARGKTVVTSQSSVGWDGHASRAADGNTSGNWADNSVTHTLTEYRPWWQIDLAKLQQIGEIKVWNRTDCCSERLSNFYVFVSDAPFASTDLNATINQTGVSTYHTAGQGGSPTTVAVNRTGRYVRVQLAGTNPLSLAEVQVLAGGGQGAQLRWLVADHLGSPRITVDQTGSLQSVRRHDYLPFGEEIGDGVGGRTAAQGYSLGDGVRQQFTGSERDRETGLDYMRARYYSSPQGRFISADPLLTSGMPTNPQTWNRYAYTANNPLRYVDPSGMKMKDPPDRQLVPSLNGGPGVCVGRDCEVGPIDLDPPVQVYADVEGEITTTSTTVGTTLHLPGPMQPPGEPDELPVGDSIPEQFGTDPVGTTLELLDTLSSNIKEMAITVVDVALPDFAYGQVDLPLLGGVNGAISRDGRIYGGVNFNGALTSQGLGSVTDANKLKLGGQAGFGKFLAIRMTPEQRHQAMGGQDINLSLGYLGTTIPLESGDPQAVMIGAPWSVGVNVTTSHHIYDLKSLWR